MTILFFSRLFYPHIGGVEKHVLEVSKRLIKAGHKVIVVTENETWAKEDSIDKIKIYRMDVGKNEFLKKFRIWIWLMRHKELIEKADVIHCHDVFFWYLPFVFMFPKKYVFTTFHGYEGNNIPGMKAIVMHKIAEKLSKGNICVGEFLAKWYKTQPSTVTYGAVDVIKSNYKMPPVKPKNISVVFVGRLEEETGILEYLKTMKILQNDGLRISLTVLGDGSLFEQCKRWIAKDKLNVKFLGFVPETQKYVIHSDFVFTSRYLGILEALAAKRYIFAVYNNEIKEDYLRMTPFVKFIATGADAQEIADKFENAIKDDTTTQEHVRSGFAWASQQTWDKMVDTYLTLWNKK